MPIIKLSDGDAFEDKPVKEGVHPLRIVKSEKRDSEAGNPMVVLTIKVEGPAGRDAALFNHWLMTPIEGTENYRRNQRDAIRFCQAFGIESFDPDSNEDIASLEGLAAELYVGLRVMKDKEGKETGETNQLRLPKAKGR